MNTTSATSHRFINARILAAAIFVISVIILLGWYFDSEILKSLVPGLVAVKANTAVCLLLSSITLWLRTCPTAQRLDSAGSFPSYVSRLSAFCSAVVVVVGLLTLLEYALNIDLGIDQWLVTERPNTTATTHAGRMAIPTALAFFLSGIAMLLKRDKQAWLFARRLTILTGFIASLAFIGQLYDILWLAAYGNYTPMGVVTSFAFILLSIGILITHPHDTRQELWQATQSMWMTGVVVALGLSILGGSIISSILRTREFQRAADRSFDYMCALKDVNTAVLNEVIASRGFILTQDSTFLRSEGPDAVRRAERLHQLCDPASAREASQADTARLVRLVHKQIDFVDQVVSLGKGGAFDEAIKKIATHEGRILMEQINWLAESLHQEELAHIQFLSTKTEDSSRRTMAAFYLGGVVMVLFLVIFLIQLTHEITQHHHSLSERNRMFNVSKDLLCTLGVDGHLQEMNPAFQQLLGVTEDVLKKAHFTQFILPDDRERSLTAMNALKGGEPILNFDNRILCKDGSIRWISWNAFPVHASEAIYAFGRDITERILAAETLTNTNSRLQTAMDELRLAQGEMVKQERMNALSIMVSGIAHDFNNALMPMIGLPDYLLSKPELLTNQEHVVDAFQEIRAAAMDAREIVRRLREFYRPNDLMTVAPVNVADLITQVISLTEPAWKVQAAAEGRHVTVKTDFAVLPDILANASSLREMLTNLVINASHAISSNGTLTLRTSGDGAFTLIQVMDTGCGMPPEVLARCFDPFFSTKGERGTGLGLSVCYGIVTRHDGTIQAESKPGVGTTFTIRLPNQGPTLGQADATLSVTAPPSTTCLRVLAVDDMPMVRALIHSYLQAEGHTVDLADNGNSGLLRLKQGGIDLVIVDRAMPDMNGEEFARQAALIAPRIRIIMLTGFGDMMTYRSERPAGVHFVLAKPVTPTELYAAVNTVMNMDILHHTTS